MLPSRRALAPGAAGGGPRGVDVARCCNVRTLRSTFGMSVLALAVVGAVGGDASGRSLPCAGGRFFVPGDATSAVLPNGASMIAVDDADGMTFDVWCDGVATRLTRKGRFTIVHAQWARCGGARHVRIVAKIAAPACSELRGVVRASGRRPTSFSARLSTWGVGHVDPLSETCDSGVGCAPGDTCTSECTCVPAPDATTTTTTTTDVATTSAVGGSTTTVGETTTTVQNSGCHVESVPYEGAYHVPVGTEIEWQHNPPASGPHYPIWTTYVDHTDVVPRGFWVHNLEHGAIVLVYRPDAPADVVAAVHAGYAAIPPDPECPHKRALATADPLLPTSFAAIAWDWVMECTGVVDVQSILDFTAEHRGHGGEDLCGQGAYE
jgi:hypothetical protein